MTDFYMKRNTGLKWLFILIIFLKFSIKISMKVWSYFKLMLMEKWPSEVFYKKGVLKILQNSQENTCVRVSFSSERILVELVEF